MERGESPPSPLEGGGQAPPGTSHTIFPMIEINMMEANKIINEVNAVPVHIKGVAQ